MMGLESSTFAFPLRAPFAGGGRGVLVDAVGSGERDDVDAEGVDADDS